MRDFVDCQKQVLVRGRSDDVGCEEEWPGDDGCVAKKVGTEALERDDCEDERDGQWLWPAELQNLYSLVSTAGGWTAYICDRTSGCALMIALLLDM